MKKTYKLSEKAFQPDGKMPQTQAIPLGLQHVLAMFVGNLTPLLIMTGTCGIYPILS
jgi:NCS2 family nucleobase:cation symporter-2